MKLTKPKRRLTQGQNPNTTERPYCFGHGPPAKSGRDSRAGVRMLLGKAVRALAFPMAAHPPANLTARLPHRLFAMVERVHGPRAGLRQWSSRPQARRWRRTPSPDRPSGCGRFALPVLPRTASPRRPGRTRQMALRKRARRSGTPCSFFSSSAARFRSSPGAHRAVWVPGKPPNPSQHSPESSATTTAPSILPTDSAFFPAFFPAGFAVLLTAFALGGIDGLDLQVQRLESPGKPPDFVRIPRRQQQIRMSAPPFSPGQRQLFRHALRDLRLRCAFMPSIIPLYPRFDKGTDAPEGLRRPVPGPLVDKHRAWR